MSDVQVVVAVPLRNEMERLPRLLHSLGLQRGAPSFILALFFDNCDDGSQAVVASIAGELPFAIVSDCCDAGGPPNAGLARRRALTLAVSAVPAGVLMTTDADSAPAPDWIASNLDALRHADVLAGRIVRAGCDAPIQVRLESYYDRLHGLRRTLDPVSYEAPCTHHWTSGASLAARRETYLAIGGFPAVPNGEDAAFVDAAGRAGFRVRRDAAVRVATSSRRIGRAGNGFAAQLSAWDTVDLPPMVCHPEDEAWRYALQGEARRLYGATRLDGLASRLHLSLREVEQVAGECRNAEAFAMRIVGSPPGGGRMVPLARAELALAALEHGRFEGAA